MSDTENNTWVTDLQKSAVLKDRAGKATKQAGMLLWKGAKEAIASFDVTTDDGEALYNGVKEALGGETRKGDASKVRAVALAVANAGLDLSETVMKAGKKTLKFNSLSTAYAEAIRLTKTVAEEAEQDDTLESVVEAIDAPKTASTPESAALVLLSKGVDGAVVAILDALNGPSGENNEAAHRAFLRALTSEVSSRIQAKATAIREAERAKRDAERTAKEAAKAAADAAKVAEAAAKAKSAPVKAAKAKPTQVKPKAAPVKVVKVVEEDDMFAEIEDEQAEQPSKPKARPAIKRPAVKRPVAV